MYPQPTYKGGDNMPETTITGGIEDIVDAKINQLPTVEVVTITTVHDTNHCDVKLNDTTIDYLLCIGTPRENETALIIPYNNTYVVITR